MRKRQYRYHVDVLRGDPDYTVIFFRSYRYKKNALRNAEETKSMLEGLGLAFDDVDIRVTDSNTKAVLFEWNGSDSSKQAWT